MKHFGINILWISLLITCATQAAIIEKIETDEFVYLLDDSNRIIVYSYADQTFETLLEIESEYAATTFDTDDGNTFYVAVDTEVREYSIDPLTSDITLNTLRRVSSEIVDLDLNGNYVVITFGASSSVIWSLSTETGDVIDSIPRMDTSDPDNLTPPEFHEILQIEPISRSDLNIYLIRLSSGAIIFSDFYESTGFFGEYDFSSQLDSEDTYSISDQIMLNEHLAITSSGEAYVYNFATIQAIEAPDDNFLTIENIAETAEPFINFNDQIDTDSTIKAISQDENGIYIAMSIDNACNTRVFGTKISYYTIENSDLDLRFSESGVHYMEFDFSETLVEFSVENGTHIHGFYYGDNGSTLQATLLETTSSRSDQIEVSFDPDSDPFTIQSDKVKTFGDSSIFINIDESCNHQILEYDTQTNSYARTVMLADETPSYSVIPDNDLFFWARNFDNSFILSGVQHTSDNIRANLLNETISGKAKLLLSLDSHLLVHYTDSNDVNTIRIYSIDPVIPISETTDTSLIIGTWDYAAWDSENQKIIFISSGKLYVWDMANPTDLENATPPIESIHYGNITNHPSPSQPIIIHNVKTAGLDLIYADGILYNLNSLGIEIDDSAFTDNTIATWTGSALYTAIGGQEGGIQKWTFTLDTPQNLELVQITEPTGYNKALVTVEISGISTPILITQNDDRSNTTFINNLDSNSTQLENNNIPSEEEDESNDTSSSGSSTNNSSDSDCTGMCLGEGGAIPFQLFIYLTLFGIIRKDRGYQTRYFP